MLGITFGLKQPDGSLPVIGIDKDGPVAMAGGRVGDIWRLIDGDPVIEVIDAWLDGRRVRRADVPLTVRIERAGFGMTIMLVATPGDETIDSGRIGKGLNVSEEDVEIAHVVGPTCNVASATEPTPVPPFDPLRAFANEIEYVRLRKRPVAQYDPFRDLSIQENQHDA